MDIESKLISCGGDRNFLNLPFFLIEIVPKVLCNLKLDRSSSTIFTVRDRTRVENRTGSRSKKSIVRRFEMRTYGMCIYIYYVFFIRFNYLLDSLFEIWTVSTIHLLLL